MSDPKPDEQAEMIKGGVMSKEAPRETLKQKVVGLERGNLEQQELAGLICAILEEHEKYRLGMQENCDLRLQNERLLAEKCQHGWRGSFPENGELIQTPCPACGLKSLFVGNGGYLTCSNVPSDSTKGCPSPIVQVTWDIQQAHIKTALAKLLLHKEDATPNQLRGAMREAVQTLEEKP